MYCSIAESGEQLKKATIPVAVATIPQVLGIKRIVFYTNGEMAMTTVVNYNSQQMNNAATKGIPDNIKPVVLKRTMRKPVVI